MGSHNSKNLIINEKKEIKQIEEWTGMKVGNIIFDSDIDNWNINSSVFYQKVINKSNLIFLIEDDDGNLFGGYIHAKIDKMGSYAQDPKSFIFSLRLNGRLDGMLKFNKDKLKHSFYLNREQSDFLFLVGYSFLRGENRIITMEGNNWDNELNLKTQFTPTRLTVIQLF